MQPEISCYRLNLPSLPPTYHLLNTSQNAVTKHWKPIEKETTTPSSSPLPPTHIQAMKTLIRITCILLTLGTALYANPTATNGNAVNFSVRAELNEKPFIHGIVVDGTRIVLFRAIGKSLQAAGLDTEIKDPCLTLYNSQGNEVAQSIPVSALSEYQVEKLQSATTATGAFPLDLDSNEAVMIYPISGAATLHAKSISGKPGELLIETYLLPQGLYDRGTALIGSHEKQIYSIQTLDSTFPDGVDDTFGLLNVRMANEKLTIELEYSGGCEDHDFELFYDPAFIETNPPQANLYLRHDGKNDSCDAIIRETRTFDLSALLDNLQLAYPNNPRDFSINLHTWIDGTETLEVSLLKFDADQAIID